MSAPRTHHIDENESLVTCKRAAINQFWAEKWRTKVAKKASKKWEEVDCQACESEDERRCFR